jgi:hypothetical protein
MRVSTTQLESFRLWRQPDQEWMPEEALRAAILNKFEPTHKVNLGQAFGRVLEDPDTFLAPGGFRIVVNEETFEFGRDVMEPCLALMDRRGVFEAKATKVYDDCTVVARADQIIGSRLIEHKTTLSTFDAQKYLDSYQWRFMADLFEPSQITYHVFCLYEAPNRVIELKSIETLNVYPYPALHEDCCGLVREFREYVMARGLDGFLRERQKAAEAA